MRKLVQDLRAKQKGFTLIELLVVVAILGTLSAVAVPNVVKFIGSGRTQAAMAEEHNIQVAITAYAVDHGGTLPPNIADVSAYLVGSPEFAWTISGNAVAPVAGNPLFH